MNSQPPILALFAAVAGLGMSLRIPIERTRPGKPGRASHVKRWAEQMQTVQITGWNYGFNKVACTSTLCSVAKLGLVEAKRTTDAVLEGKVQHVSLESAEEALRLVDFLESHGAIARVI
jgi:ribosomal protein L7/L12